MFHTAQSLSNLHLCYSFNRNSVIFFFCFRILNRLILCTKQTSVTLLPFEYLCKLLDNIRWLFLHNFFFSSFFFLHIISNCELPFEDLVQVICSAVTRVFFVHTYIRNLRAKNICKDSPCGSLVRWINSNKLTLAIFAVTNILDQCKCLFSHPIQSLSKKW